MKVIVVVLAVCFAAALGELTDEQKEKLKTYKESCISETGVDPNVVKNAKEGMIDESDEKLACFATCLLKKMGMMKENGDIDIDAVRSKIPSNIPQEEADRVINICKDITGTGCWKGGNIMKCVLQNKKVPLVH
ncbi:general odorant-binding protein 83a-like [Odontomachus brunneus]|uniref:general odorant-binding protein 83a-like n=1 Tax=Odontomachus brunneus TaxID=486640 RepID=UPI0013F1BC11|nr:general odorant-binding protein 83a-like [Odontomachus brunneus]